MRKSIPPTVEQTTTEQMAEFNRTPGYNLGGENVPNNIK